jgi:hypothetical protein
MKKNDVFVTIAFFITILIVLMMPGVRPAFGVSGNITYFNVTATVNGGSPTVTYVYAINDSPNEGTTKVVHFYFNATHPNGVANIPAQYASIRINQSGTTLISSGCSVLSTDGVTLNRYDCNVTIYFYTLPGAWTINATISDAASNIATNTGSAYTNGNTYGVTLDKNTMGFGGNAGASGVPSTDNPQKVNNTGNVAYGQINITAISLQSGVNVIGAGNFTANTTAAAQQLANNTPVTITDSSIAVNGSRNVYLYLNIPSGVSNGTYTSTGQWTVTVS